MPRAKHATILSKVLSERECDSPAAFFIFNKPEREQVSRFRRIFEVTFLEIVQMFIKILGTLKLKFRFSRKIIDYIKSARSIQYSIQKILRSK